jgi:hypothetical protein
MKRIGRRRGNVWLGVVEALALWAFPPALLAQNIQPSPASLTFDAVQGGASPPSQMVTVSHMRGPPFNGCSP